MLLTESWISRRLAAVQKGEPLENPYPPDYIKGERKPAAVLVPFTRIDGEWHVLFIRRADNPRDIHSGQVAFPGGRQEEDDADTVVTALRESHEEIGLSPSDVTVLGSLRDFLSVGNYRVTPVVGIIPWPYRFELQHEEVARTFTIPYAWLSRPENYEARPRENPGWEDYPVIYFDKYDGELLWGATARMVVRLVDVLSEVPPP